MTSHINPSPFAVWLWAVRPRTLPLAVAAICLGYGLAVLHGPADGRVFVLALTTAVLLQILSNLANDYGDAVAGTDTEDRVGPARMVGSGLATPKGMLQAIVLAAALALASGLALLVTAAWGRWGLFWGFVLLGAASVVAAIAYTMGKRPYGYMGLGDIMVWIFFGPVAVLGSAVLCGSGITPGMWLPAGAAGLCSTAVLNVNNMRDMETDRANGKMTLAVRLGPQRARWYHAALIGAALIAWILFCLGEDARMAAGLAAAWPLVRSAWKAVSPEADAACLNAQLRATVLGTAFLNIVMGVLCGLRGLSWL